MNRYLIYTSYKILGVKKGYPSKQTHVKQLIILLPKR